MIACACGMSEWLVECECVCRQMDEWWSVDGMNVIVLHEVHATQAENWTVLSCYETYIYYDRSVCVRDQRDRERKKTWIKSVWKTGIKCPFWRLLSTSIWLAWMDWKDTNNKQPTAPLTNNITWWSVIWSAAKPVRINILLLSIAVRKS